ncbi:hypothetical protein [Streptomyces bullii]|uniref:Bacteriocin-type signal sequence-containing protein n=1 Tax=Streptomyces bullii TaxID=349910 RepID=A0ABW0UX06_9ACTN
MNLVPQVHTTEISDADLDGIAGGQAGGAVAANAAGAGAAGLYVEAGPLCAGAGVGLAASPAGIAADAHVHAGLN